MNTSAAVTTDPRPLHLFSADSEEYVIAYDAEDALAVYCQTFGLAPGASDDPDADDFCTHASHWTAISDHTVLPRHDECEENRHRDGETCRVEGCSKGLVRRTMTAAEWVAHEGRGYWGGTNW